MKHINPNELNRDKQFTPTQICRNAKKRGGCGHKFNLTLLDKEQGQAKQGTCVDAVKMKQAKHGFTDSQGHMQREIIVTWACSDFCL